MMRTKGLRAGYLLVPAMLITLYQQFTSGQSSWLAGVLIWGYFLLTCRTLNPKQLKQTTVLMGIGTVLLAISAVHAGQLRLALPILDANQQIITLLAAISFLKLIAGVSDSDRRSKGRQAIASTLLGTHIMAAVINVSAMALIADRIQKEQRLSPSQGITLSRAFGTAAFWSPFFAAMGVTLIGVPNAELGPIILYTLPVSLIALGASYYQLIKHSQSAPYFGFAISRETLKLPLTMALMVLAAHQLLPEISVITWVSTLSVLIVVLTLAWKRKTEATISALQQHVSTGLARSAGEVALFLSATVLASGLSASLQTLNIDLTPATFGATEASLTLLLLIGLALIGVHPVTSNLICAAILAPVADNPNLLAMTLLFAWSLGITLSPLSGSQILLQTRYGVRARDLARSNLFYAPLMLCTCTGALFLMDHLS